MGKSLYKFQDIIGVSIFAALGTILMFFEFPVLIWLPFLKVDLSDVVAVVGTFAFGPVGGIMIALLKSMVHLLVTGTGLAGLIGDGAAFVGSVALLLPFAHFWKKDKKNHGSRQWNLELDGHYVIAKLFCSHATLYECCRDAIKYVISKICSDWCHSV